MKLKFLLFISIIFLIIFIGFSYHTIDDSIFSVFNGKKFSLKISFLDTNIHTLTKDTLNETEIKVFVYDSNNNPVANKRVDLSCPINSGRLNPPTVKTNSQGEALTLFIPAEKNSQDFNKTPEICIIEGKLSGTKTISQLKLSLVKVPIIFIHGYNAGSYMYSDMVKYLDSLGYISSTLDYKSQEGVLRSSIELEKFIAEQKLLYYKKGLKLKRFDIVAHSMGGLITRYYTSGNRYANDVRKIIFISVPQKGSLWASVVSNYFKDQGISDLIPTSTFLNNSLAALPNQGLNENLQIGSLLAQYDEVVSEESASLSKWNIPTELLYVGEKTLTMPSILSGNLVQTANHLAVLSNKNVIEKVADLLNTTLNYPAKIK